MQTKCLKKIFQHPDFIAIYKLLDSSCVSFTGPSSLRVCGFLHWIFDYPNHIDHTEKTLFLNEVTVTNSVRELGLQHLWWPYNLRTQEAEARETFESSCLKPTLAT